MQDILLDKDTMDLAFAGGDLVVGFSDQQHQQLLLLLDKGSLKENPIVGVGSFKFLEGEDAAGYLREVRTQFAQDGMEVKQVGFENNKLQIHAPYR